MKNFVEIMEGIRKRPGMYTGEKSLRKLSWYLEGYTFCRNEMDEEEFTFIEEFQEFVEKKYRMDEYNIDFTKSYVDIISLFYGDYRAVDKFFELYDEFMEIKGIELE